MAEEQSQAIQLTEYTGSCHCGDFQFCVKLAAAPIRQAAECNCSVCARKSYFWVFPASIDHFRVTKEDVKLKAYLFGKKKTEHRFCPKCGSAIMGFQKDGRGIAVNVRSLHDINLDKLELQKFNGEALAPPYDPPQPPSALLAEEGREIYNGNCHCGAVTYSVKSEPLNKEGPKVATCDCSICTRNGELWLYPRKSEILIHGEDALTDYMFGEKRTAHRFCGTCGVSIFNQPLNPKVDMLPVNTRTIQGVNLTDLNVEMKYFPPVTFIED